MTFSGKGNHVRSVIQFRPVRPRHTTWGVPRLAVLVGSLFALTGLFAAATDTPLASGAGAAGVASAPYPVGNAASGYLAELTDPTGSPPGVNVSGCRPAASGPRQYPVILLPGTLYDLADTWQALGPILADDGWCMYGLNYGAAASTTLSGGRIWSVGDIPTSAGQLATFVRKVLVATGARKVDIVGWSQGGMMPRWYMRFDEGAAFVHDLVGLAPSNHGTTVKGASTLLDAVTALGLPAPLTLAQCLACTQQLVGSAILHQLNAGADTLPGIRYTVIESKDDEVVTPYTSAYLSGSAVTNLTLQDQCPNDHADHLAMPYDGAALQDVVQALDDAPSFSVRCGLGLPLLGG
jgi:triacylglycerol esterase/lipase EstA (alpha/beta hydrolase family)